ncbi:predicted protein [Sclerotinia sclerotiorum 1980 UF-70]|uniref:Uncharacterized protein n=1 Tax=Sclerotinia sclerotiorum (strain ATCC 18683 / 1980 / Ss-1) TaxID=665079 RepID=A7EV07_SCLS1|nr:predicted protein [Sclerotinia sclerotiorum 1980 UF-70]EDN93299.1 predicted protein [Sclerotinia sclerotiorum 1980 UF-70]
MSEGLEGDKLDEEKLLQNEKSDVLSSWCYHRIQEDEKAECVDEDMVLHLASLEQDREGYVLMLGEPWGLVQTTQI